MIDWTAALHSLAGALVGAGAGLSGSIIMANRMTKSERRSYQHDHEKWAHDLAAQAHDGYIVEFERLTPFYGASPDPSSPDWIYNLHTKLQRMRLVCSPLSVALAGMAMKELDRYVTTGSEWQPVQDAFSKYLIAAREDIGLPALPISTDASNHRFRTPKPRAVVTPDGNVVMTESRRILRQETITVP